MASLIQKTEILENSYETIRFQISLYVFLKDFPLSKGEVNALAVFYKHGLNQQAIDKILEMQIFKNRQTVENFLSKLVRLEVIKKTNKRQKAFTKLIPVEVDDKILINLKIGNK